MKKETIILLGLGAVAVYFLMRNKRAKGEIIVESPEKISEEEFGNIEQMETQNQRGQVIDVIKTVAQKGASAIERAKLRRKAKKAVKLPFGTATIDLEKARKIARQKARKQKRAQRKAVRLKRRNKKLGDISIMF